MTSLSEDRIAELWHREAIRDCLIRYCHGADRRDFAMIENCYWPDAYDDHGIFKGTVPEFLTWAEDLLSGMDQTLHTIGNIMIRIVGNSANVESHCHAFHRFKNPEGVFVDVVFGHRYLDRMERRGEEWRIANRVIVVDWFREYPDSADWTGGPFGAGPPPNRAQPKPDDLYYQMFGTEQ